MVSLNQLAIVSGMLVVYFVNYFIAAAGDEPWNVAYGWRWMFASETVPAIALLVLLFFVPESPRWLVKQQRAPEALEILARVNGYTAANTELLVIKDTLKMEQSAFSLLFARGMLLALMIGISLAVLQQVTGINVFLYYAPEIFRRISRASVNAAMLQTIVVGAVNMSFTIIAIWTVDQLGRKPLMFVGFAGMAASLFALGAAAYLEQTGIWVLLFILTYIASFSLSVGPVTWVILSEIFPTGIRGLAMAIATVMLWLANFIVSQTFPMMDQNAWLIDKFHHAFPFWLYGSLCLVAILFLWRFVPETKGRSLEEIERHWLRLK
jgi:SP family xylose:H+ symportor-like MFS transporter